MEAVDRRQAWAATVAQLIDQETAGNRSRFAQLVGVTYKTVIRWLSAETDVSENNVRKVAQALRIKPAVLLVQAGLYDKGELVPSTSEPPTAADDPAMRLILDADLPPHRKRQMVERLRKLRQREVEEVEFWITQARGE